jgi:hypothetical protein
LPGDSDNLCVSHRGLVAVLIGEGVVVTACYVPAVSFVDDPVSGQSTTLDFLGPKRDNVAFVNGFSEVSGDSDEPVARFQRRLHTPRRDKSQEDGLAEYLAGNHCDKEYY